MNMPGIRLMIATATFVLGVTATLSWVAIRKPFSRVEKPGTKISARKPPAGDPTLNLPPNDSTSGTILALKGNRVDSFDPLVPSAAQNLIVKLKHQLRGLILETLNRYAYKYDSPERLETMLNDELKNAGVGITRDTDEIDGSTIPEYFVYGDVYEFNVSRPAGHRNLIAVTTTIGVCCGEDTSLYLFKYAAHRWNLILTHESEIYDEVSGAHGRFQFAISPPKADGDFFVVTASVTPWCTSNWQTLRYAVLKPVYGTDKPRLILSRQNSIFLYDDPAYKLILRTRGFQLSFFDEKIMDMMNEGKDLGPDDINARRLLSYKVKGDSATLQFRQ